MVETRRPATGDAGICEAPMKRKIIGFDQDGDQDWRARLFCGHYQHVRHDPPLITREWILTAAGRDEKIGAELECRKCDDKTPKDLIIDQQKYVG